MTESYPPYGTAPQYYQQQPASPPRGGFATAALVLGILALVSGVIPGVNFVAYPLAVLAIIFGILAIQWGRAKAGLILGILGLIATILWTIAFIGIFHHAKHCYDESGGGPISQRCLQNG